MDPRSAPADDEVLEGPRERRAHGIEPFGVPDLARDYRPDLRQSSQGFGLGVPDRAPPLDLAELDGEPLGFGACGVTLGAELGAELALILGVDPAVRVIAPHARQSLLGATRLVLRLVVQCPHLGQLAIARLGDRTPCCLNVDPNLFEIAVHRRVNDDTTKMGRRAELFAEFAAPVQ